MHKNSKLMVDPTFYERFSHELRTTLTGVQGFSEYIQHHANEPMMKFTAQVVNEGSKDILRIIDAYFYVLNHRDEGISISSFSVVRVVDETILLMRESALARSVKMVLNVDDDAWAVRMISDVSNFKRIVELILHDFIESSSDDDDLITVEICVDDAIEKVKLKFLKYGWGLSSAVMSLYKNYYIDGVSCYQKQGGPGVCAGLARFFIEKLSGELNASVTSDDAFCLEMVFPYSVQGVD